LEVLWRIILFPGNRPQKTPAFMAGVFGGTDVAGYGWAGFAGATGSEFSMSMCM